MIEPLKISENSIPRAIERIRHYRLLNEPGQAESICRDILAVQPDHQEALINLLLTLTDQFTARGDGALEAARAELGRIEGDFEQAYYRGMIHERWARALHRRHPDNPAAAIAEIHEAMDSYQQAIELATRHDPDPTLRWNACARFFNALEADGGAP